MPAAGPPKNAPRQCRCEGCCLPPALPEGWELTRTQGSPTPPGQAPGMEGLTHVHPGVSQGPAVRQSPVRSPE